MLTPALAAVDETLILLDFVRHTLYGPHQTRAAFAAVTDSGAIYIYIYMSIRLSIRFESDYRSIHTQALIAGVFRDYIRLPRHSCLHPHNDRVSSIRSRQHSCPHHNPTAYADSSCVPRERCDQSIHAETILPFVFQEHEGTRVSMPKP